jgi:anti-sigma regulatory factor (Ser/Thr protein kinase)
VKRQKDQKKPMLMNKSLKVKSELREIEKVRRFLQESLKELDLSEEAFYLIELSILEMCINIVRYAYPQDKGEISIKVWCRDGELFFEIKDWGIPFNPEESTEPNVQEMVDQKQIGGLGIFLSRKLMNGFRYRREKGQNILTMYKKIDRTKAT